VSDSEPSTETGAASSGQPTFTLHLGDCVEWLRSLPDQSVALCVCDPAYSSLEKHRAIGTTTRLKQSKSSSNEWFPVIPNDYFVPLMEQLYRVLAKNAHLYVFSDQETAFDVTKPTGLAAGFTWWKAIIWVKTKGYDSKRAIPEDKEVHQDEIAIGMGYHWRASHECISFLEKGKRKLNHLGWPDVLPAARVRDAYPTEKPVSLVRTLIENSSSPGELVIDPFTGSGAHGEAALRAGRRFAGCDISPKSIDLARTRLSRFGVDAS
jgi:site-specific DNA-methyltransferase (adenine-specific)